jgi:hypothetical protein
MEPLQAVLFLAAFVLIGAVAIALRFIVASLRPQTAPQTNRRRQPGDNEPVDLDAVATRARGTTAWMRPDGGGF